MFAACFTVDDRHNAARNNKVKSVKGGVALEVHASFRQYIMSQGVLPSHKRAYVTIKHPQLGNIGFLGIYTPNEAQNRTAL
jgi:hypothetical protein